MAQTTSVAPGLESKKAGSSSRLEDQAAIAALYVTKYDTALKAGHNVLDSNNRLSSAGEFDVTSRGKQGGGGGLAEYINADVPATGAAASIKYAQPQDLPSYPSSGLKNGSAASAAASLGWANQKPFEHWKPDPSASASAAAVMAKDYKMKPLWQPEQSSNGAKAALVAHKDGGKVDIWKPEASTWGNSAASLAFKKYGASEPSPILNYGYNNLNRQGSLIAATGAMSMSRRRAESMPAPPPPETYPDERNAADNALKAAMSVSRSKKRAESSGEAGSVPYTNLPKEMFTSHPPVAPEVEELNRQNTIRASAVAMARGMYNQQQKLIEAEKANNASQGARAAHRRPSTSSYDEASPMYLGNVQEAAQKLAQERLAKLHDDHAKNREYLDYYGSTRPPSKLSIRGRVRRRASSDGTLDEDREQSNKIRAQMSLFSSSLSQIDEKKRAQDREALIAIAQRNVTKSLHGMDEKVFADTGKVAPSLLSEWEVKAHAAAQAKSQSRMENYGKVDIGGGKFVDQSAVDMIAAKNVQPVLDEINEKAAVERERQAALKAEQAEQLRKANEKKQREKEGKAINKKLRHKDEEKAKKAEEKAARGEEKRLEKEKRKSAKLAAAGASPEAAITEPKNTDENIAAEAPQEATSPVPPVAIVEPAPVRTSMEDQASMRMQENADAANPDTVTPMSPTSPKDDNKVKQWLKSKFSRRLSKPPKPATSEPKEDENENENENRRSFIGGASLAEASANNSTSSLGANSSSMRDVALAGKAKEPEGAEEPADHDRIGRGAKRHSEVSALTSEDEFQEARDEFDEGLAPPPTFPTSKSSSPVRDSKFKEAI